MLSTRHFICLISFLTLLNGWTVSAGESATVLRFKENGTFRIVQFADLHWSHRSPGKEKTADLITYILATEKPDLAVLTGDNVTDSPAGEAWQVITRIFEDARIPWAITFGNHDSETDIAKPKLITLLQQSPYFIGETGPNNIHGCGNYVHPILASQADTPAAALYFLDSNHYPPLHKIGAYGWINHDQITWYREQSRRFTEANQQAPLPSLAFFHIPLVEYNYIKKSTAVGNRREGSGSSNVNSGLLSAILEMGDVMGTFVGHDHDQDYIGIEQDIALGYGRVTGIQASGRREKGARVIELHEGRFTFDTWIRTRQGAEFAYHFPPAVANIPQDTALAALPALPVTPTQQGVRYSYYEGRFKSSLDITPDKLKQEGTQPDFSIVQAAAQDSFAYVFDTYIQIPTSGLYRFYTFSDDGSKLLIDDQVVVDNDGSHNARRVDGLLALEAGFHRIKLYYLENYMGQVLEVGFASKDMREGKIPPHLLFLPPVEP